MIASSTGVSGTAGAGTGSPNPLIESDRVEGTSVYGADNRHIGTIKRLMIDKRSGQVAYAVMTFGGFLGIGEESYTIPWAKLTYEVDLGGYRTDISSDQLQGAPTFYRDGDYRWSNRDQERELHSYYGVSPYWGL
ncbi:MAG: PRC-barrel domain-containing protein [Methylobacteriaceae bacterium]|nr:PRC-barrel domain-containing protein [Methylobacteriaceae bacterium]